MKSFWQFYKLLESQQETDFHLGKLNVTCLYNKTKQFFKRELANNYINFLQKVVAKTVYYKKKVLKNIKDYMQKIDDHLNFKTNTDPDVSILKDVIFVISDTDLWKLTRMLVLLHPENVKESYKAWIKHYSKSSNPIEKAIETTGNMLIQNIVGAEPYSEGLYEFILQCRKIEEIDWRPTETVPEDYYAR